MIKFYKCEHCGNVIVKVLDAGVPVQCCGESMVELVANTQDAALEKHVPVVTKTDSGIHVVVGEVEHPMTEEHLINFIVVDKGDAYDIATLDPSKSPQADFTLGDGEKVEAVYEYCNLHGLWKA